MWYWMSALLFRQHLAVVLDTELLAQFTRLGGLVEFMRAVGACKADGEGLVGHQAGRDIAGIDTAGQERAQLDVADAVGGHALPHAGINLIGVVGWRKSTSQ